MKIPVWYLVVLLACLFTPGRSDCQGECVACGLLLQQQQLQQAFNTMVCLLECEGHVSPSLTWEVCKRAVKLSHHPATLSDGGALLKRAGEELALTSLDLSSDNELLQSAAAERFQEGDQDETPFEQRSVQYDSSLLESSEEEEEEEGGLQGLDLGLVDEDRKQRGERNVERDSQLEEDEDDTSEAVTLSKRFGGFQRGRHGYRKLIGSPARPLQKRYGGFIGVRKSARKWNNQKRVNQLLRQYLGMRSSRSGKFNSIPVTRVWRQNKL
ncbi:prepronociceptin b isoform 1-T4 [Acanthopagrus schlegelii]